MAFSPDGKILASGDLDDTARLWDVATRQPIGTLPAIGGTQWRSAQMARSWPPAATIDIARLWDVVSLTGLAALTGAHRQVNSVAFSPDGKILASGSADGTVRLWDVATRRQIGVPLTGHARTR